MVTWTVSVSHACKQIRWIPEGSHVIHNISVRLFFCCHAVLIGLERRLRIGGSENGEWMNVCAERSECEKRVRTKRLLALLSVQTFYYVSITLLTIKENFRLSRF